MCVQLPTNERRMMGRNDPPPSRTASVSFVRYKNVCDPAPGRISPNSAKTRPVRQQAKPAGRGAQLSLPEQMSSLRARQFDLLFTLATVEAHGAVTQPPSRNAIDGAVLPWNGSVPDEVPFMFWCASPDAASLDRRKVSGVNGQACFWFNNGCDISCDECDGATGQVIHPRFTFNGTGSPAPWGGGGIVPDPTQASPVSPARPDGSRRLSICRDPKRNATICDPAVRTMNVNAACGSAADVTFYAPWRFPGAAPVIDSCGTAGGVYQWQGPAAAGGDYQTTAHAQLGDLGSALPRAPSGTVWEAGAEVEVAWTHKAWHGGGYQYRLCPAGRHLDEECFQSHPLPFADGTSTLRWGGVGATAPCEAGRYHNCTIHFNATDVGGSAVVPHGSTWRRCPIPRAPWAWAYTGATFDPICEESDACTSYHGPGFSGPGCGGDTASCSTGAYPLRVLRLGHRRPVPARDRGQAARARRPARGGVGVGLAVGL